MSGAEFAREKEKVAQIMKEKQEKGASLSFLYPTIKLSDRDGCIEPVSLVVGREGEGLKGVGVKGGGVKGGGVLDVWGE